MKFIGNEQQKMATQKYSFCKEKVKGSKNRGSKKRYSLVPYLPSFNLSPINVQTSKKSICGEYASAKASNEGKIITFQDLGKKTKNLEKKIK